MSRRAATRCRSKPMSRRIGGVTRLHLTGQDPSPTGGLPAGQNRSAARTAKLGRQAAQQPTVHSCEPRTASNTAARFMSLRLGPPDSAGGARNGDELQLLVMPAHGRDMGLLRTWRSPHPRPPRKHGKLHLGWSDPEERSVQDLRDRHSLGAAWTRARRSSWSEPAELWTRAPGVYRRQAVRWGRYMGIPGL